MTSFSLSPPFFSQQTLAARPAQPKLACRLAYGTSSHVASAIAQSRQRRLRPAPRWKIPAGETRFPTPHSPEADTWTTSALYGDRLWRCGLSEAFDPSETAAQPLFTGTSPDPFDRLFRLRVLTKRMSVTPCSDLPCFQVPTSDRKGKSNLRVGRQKKGHQSEKCVSIAKHQGLGRRTGSMQLLSATSSAHLLGPAARRKEQMSRGEMVTHIHREKK